MTGNGHAPAGYVIIQRASTSSLLQTGETAFAPLR